MASTTEPPYGVSNPQVEEFTSWGDYMRHVQEAPANVPASERYSRTAEADKWLGDVTFDQSVKLALDGWKAGTDRIHELSRRLEARVLHRIVRDDVNYDVEGMMFDVSRYLEGEPEHWTKPEESTVTVEHGSKHVKILVNISASAGVSPDCITARGAAIAALVELLEYGDHRVELWICDASAAQHGGKPVHVNMVRLKTFDQPLDIDRTAFALAHPAMLRRLMFSCMECAHPGIVQQVTHRNSYGYPAEYRGDTEVSVYLGACKLWDEGVEWTSPASVEAWVLGQLAAQGIVLRDD